MELFIFALGATVLFKIIRAFRRAVEKKDGSGAPLSTQKDSQRERPGLGPKAPWVGAGESPEVAGYVLPGGLVYVGKRLTDYSGYNDPCLINPELRAAPGASFEEPPSDVPVNYGLLTPEERGAYLSWLAGGRKASEVAPPYVFLFFYGLERRIIVDGRRGGLSPEERAEVVAEVRRLMEIYGETANFRGHSMNLLAMEWALYGHREDPPHYIDFTEPLCAEAFKALLARYAARVEAIPVERALQWVALRGALGGKVNVDAFRELFARRYEEKFGVGMVIHPSRSPLILNYKGASPSLREGVKIPIPGLPDPFVISAPVFRLTDLAEKCVAELEINT